MAAAHAGNKRSYQQMQDVHLERRGSLATALSERGPLSRPYSPASRASTPPHTEASNNASARRSRKAAFEPSASVVLIGIRGVGKSTLGVLAATAYSRLLIDSDKIFSEATGSTASAYRKIHGTQEYQQRHNQVLKSTLETYSSNAIIVSSFSDLEKDGVNLMREYAQTHPVIHVMRDAEGIQSYLQAYTIERIKELQLASSALLRSCSNFDFFNLSEKDGRGAGSQTPQVHPAEGGDNSSSNGNFLTLKNTERDFLRLLRNVLGDYNRGPSHQSAYPLSSVKIEDRKYSFAVAAKLSDVLGLKLDLDTLQIGADCVELVVDKKYSTKPPIFADLAKAFAILRRRTILPICITPGKSLLSGDKERAELLELIHQSLRLGPELCTIDISLDSAHLRQLIACKGNSKVIGATDLPVRPPGGWHNTHCIDVYKRTAGIGCDLAKITMPADTISDAFAVYSFKQMVSSLKMPTPLIAYCTGVRGRMSKCFNGILTPVEQPLENEGTASQFNDEDDHVTAKAVTEALFSSFVLQPLDFFIFGGDVGDSLSPPMHNAAYTACGMQYNCSTYSSDKLDDFKELSRRTNFGGSAVAHPFKRSVFEIMDGLSPHAKAIGAINTVVPIRELTADGKIPEESVIIAQRREQGPVKALYGFNTDWIGIRACIRRGLSPANTVRPHSSALVCGAGGMARSAIYSLISLGVQNIFVCNRTLSNAVALAEYYKDLIGSGEIANLINGQVSKTHIQVLETFTSAWPGNIRYPTIIVNCIPRLDGEDVPVNVTLSDAWLKSPTGGVLVEVAYRLPASPLVTQIKERAHAGWIILDGFQTLPEQNFSQFELFTGRRAPRKEILKQSLRYKEKS